MPATPVAAKVTIVSGQTGLPCDPLIFTLDRPTEPATIALRAAVSDQFGAPFVDTVDWSTSRADVVTVVAGVVTPSGIVGTCNIIAAAHSNAGITASVQVDVAEDRPFNS
jgi:hypothetical protein